MPAYRTGAQGRTWQKRRPVTASREDVRDLELEAERFRRLAPVLGWCSACGVDVDEAGGKLHDVACPYLPAERRRSV